jgi:hypothetical protein
VNPAESGEVVLRIPGFCSSQDLTVRRHPQGRAGQSGLDLPRESQAVSLAYS